MVAPAPGFKASDDAIPSKLDDHADDPVRRELIALRDLNEDEQVNLVGLARPSDGELDDWDDIRAEVMCGRNKRTAEYLIGMPLLGDHLQEALTQFNHSEEFRETTLTDP